MSCKWFMIVGASVLMAFMLVFPSLQGRNEGVLGDDAMRMVEATDLLHGQAWTDTTNYRDNTPYGARMHWSRLIDAPLAGLMAVAAPLAGDQAPTVAAYVWPLLLLLGFFTLVVALSDRLGGPASRVPVLALSMLALPIFSEFTPGRADHHNVQILLTLATMLATIGGRTSARAAMVAGLLVATCLAIGTESLPTVVVALGAFPLFWVADPHLSRRPATLFAASFALATAAHLLIAQPWSALLSPACDALSITYATVAMLYAVAVILAMLTSVLGWPWRLIALGSTGTIALVVAAVLFPHCLGGPYGDLDPLIATTLLTDIGEAQAAWDWLPGAAPGGASMLLLPVTGLCAALIACGMTRGDKRIDWLVLLGFSAVLVMVMLLQVRGLRLASLPALPAGAWLVTLAWQRFRARQTLVSAGVVALTCFLFAGAVHYAVALRLPLSADRAAIAEEDVVDTMACIEPASYGKLASLPPGRIISYLIIGPQILYTTPHSVVSAGYHRNAEGLRDAIRFFSGDEAEALTVVRKRGLNYYVYCNGIPPENGLHGLKPFHPLDAQGKLWSWLAPLTSPEEPIQIYAITPPA